MATQFAPLTVRPDGLKGKKAQEYVAQVLGMLHALDALQTGRAVLNGLRFYRRPVLLHPYDGSLGECNAGAGKTWGLFSARVTFTPYIHGRHVHCVSETPGHYDAGDNPHEVLLHELTHAVRAVAGTLGCLPRDDEEEIAMLVANIYSSETNRRLRAEYDVPGEVSEDPQVYARQYLEDWRPLIQALHKQHPDFTRFLARVKAPFNPLRLYFDEVRPPGW